MKKSLLISLVFLPLISFANPSPFGLEISKSTISDAKEKYHLKFIDINKYSQGKMFYLDTSNIKFDGLKSAIVIFNKEQKLVGVLSTFDKFKFDYLLKALNKKYKLVSKNIPFVGNKSAKFIDENTEITLDSPHLSFELQVSYMNKQLLSTYETQFEKEKMQKQKKEQAQL